LNSGLCTCKAGTSKSKGLQLEPHIQSILLWLFWRWDLVNYLPRMALNCNLLISASQVARITGVSLGLKVILPRVIGVSHCGLTVCFLTVSLHSPG
jgi:hypothetical protein